MTNEVNEKRNTGIDILRILSMFAIVTLHLIEHGGILSISNNVEAAIFSGIQGCIIWAVDCYAIISGYVGFRPNKELNISKYLLLWLEVWTYSFLITGFFYLKNDTIVLTDVIRAFFPIIGGSYWYFSAYTVLFFIMPILNRFISLLSKQQLTKTVFLLLGVFSIWGTINITDSFKISWGYSFSWLIVLYVLGAWLKVCDVPQMVNTPKIILVFTINEITLFLLSIFKIPYLYSVLISYISPLVVINATCLVILCSKKKSTVKKIRLLTCLSSSTFGVYLLHDNKAFRTCALSTFFDRIQNWSSFEKVSYLILIAICIFVSAVCIEIARNYLVHICKIDKLSLSISQKIEIFESKVITFAYEKLGI